MSLFLIGMLPESLTSDLSIIVLSLPAILAVFPNLMLCLDPAGSLEVMEVLGTCDEVLQLVAAAVCKPSGATPNLPEPPSKPLEPPDQPGASQQPGQKEATNVLPGASVLTIATTD